MKTIIAGSRGFDDYTCLCKAMDKLHPERIDISEVVSGCAQGADRLGEQWAKACGIPVKQFPADWNGLGKYAGFKRNEQMVEYADALVAFWDWESHGTWHTIKIAVIRALPVWVIDYQNGLIRRPKFEDSRVVVSGRPAVGMPY